MIKKKKKKKKKSEKQDYFEEEITNFEQQFLLVNSFSNLNEIWKKINRCISGYLIKESYYKTFEDRIKNFDSKESQSTSDRNNNDYVYLRSNENGRLTKIDLVYHIEDEKLYYMQIRHPLIPAFIGTTEEND